MRLPEPSSFTSDRALRRLALLVTGVVGVALLIWFGPQLSRSLGDPDDALRLSIVRDLEHGRGWFDQRIDRLQPPLGTWMHWSRLIDGGLALSDRAFGLVLPPPAAELATRILWPLAWIFPAALAVLVMARRLAPEAARGQAVLAAAALLILALPIYGQFAPGRVDHHDAQIALCLLALAGALTGGAGLRGAMGAGIATGLGLAIGLEALPFEAAIGAGLALRFVVDAPSARRARSYAMGLLASTLLAFLAQTPPSRLGFSACDALALNLVSAIGVAGAGLIAAASLTAGRSWRVRIGAVGGAGAAALAVYLAFKPVCIGGAFAEVDPRLRPFWFDHIAELESFPTLLLNDPAEALGFAAAAFAGAAALWSLWRDETSIEARAALAINGACLLLATLAGAFAERMAVYVPWFALAPAAAFAGRAVQSGGRRFTIVAGRRVLAGFTLLGLGGAALAAGGVIKPAALFSDPPDPCFGAPAYADLARLPAGVVLAEQDLGSYVLAHTPSSALAAPYHRMTWGDLSAHAALAAPVDQAQAQVRALKVGYVLECRAHSRHFDRHGLPPDALQRRLDAGRPPAWLERVSAPGAVVVVYRVSTAAYPPTRS